MYLKSLESLNNEKIINIHGSISVRKANIL